LTYKGILVPLLQEVRDFVKNEVPSDLLKKMDKDEITYPRE